MILESKWSLPHLHEEQLHTAQPLKSMLCTFPSKPLALWAASVAGTCAGISLLQLWNTHRQRQVPQSWPHQVQVAQHGPSSAQNNQPESPQTFRCSRERRDASMGKHPMGCYGIPGACPGCCWIRMITRAPPDFLHPWFKSSCLASKMLRREGARARKLCGTGQIGSDCHGRGHTGCSSLCASRRTPKCWALVVSPFAECPCSQAADGESWARQVGCTARIRREA